MRHPRDARTASRDILSGKAGCREGSIEPGTRPLPRVGSLRGGCARPGFSLTGYVVVAVLALATSAHAADQSPAFPSFDLDGYCHTQASYSYAATLGDSSFDGVLALCQAREADAKATAAALWPRAAPKLAADCVGLADGKYSWLARCLDQGRR